MLFVVVVVLFCFSVQRAELWCIPEVRALKEFHYYYYYQSGVKVLRTQPFSCTTIHVILW